MDKELKEWLKIRLEKSLPCDRDIYDKLIELYRSL